jgi:hypothetical protein
MSEQDWTEKKAIKIVSNYFTIPKGTDSKPECMIRDIAQALREAQKIELPEPTDIQAIRTLVGYERQKDGTDKKKLYVDYDWLKSYIESRRR